MHTGIVPTQRATGDNDIALGAIIGIEDTIGKRNHGRNFELLDQLATELREHTLGVKSLK